MKHTVIESERIVVYLSKTDDNLLKLEAFPKCQIQLNKAVANFVASTFDFDYDNHLLNLPKDEEDQINIERILTFIHNYDSTNSDIDILFPCKKHFAERAINKLMDDLIKNNYILMSTSFELSSPDVFDKLFDVYINYYGMSFMGFVVFDILALAKKACEYEDLWDDNDECIVKHKNAYYGVSINA